MIVFTKDPASPEMLEMLKKEGKVLIEVTMIRKYILHGESHRGLDALMHEWFVEYRGRSHAYRDGSHIGGSDAVSEVKVLTEEGRVILIKNPVCTNAT